MTEYSMAKDSLLKVIQLQCLLNLLKIFSPVAMIIIYIYHQYSPLVMLN
jgi:hypothetical protein